MSVPICRVVMESAGNKAEGANRNSSAQLAGTVVKDTVSCFLVDEYLRIAMHDVPCGINLLLCGTYLTQYNTAPSLYCSSPYSVTLAVFFGVFTAGRLLTFLFRFS